MTSVAERHDAVLAEQARFAQGRGATAPQWLRDLRARGAARFAALGFPTVRQEDWRFTNVAPDRGDAVPSRRSGADQRRESGVAREHPLSRARASSFSTATSRRSCLMSDALPAGVVAGSLARHLASDAPEVAHLGQVPWEHAPFVALNTAFLEDGAFIAVPANTIVEHPIHVVVINGGAGKTMAHPRTLIVVGANSQVRVAQTFLGAAGECHFTNAVTEVSLGENATLDLVTDQRETDTAYHMAAMHVHLQRSSTFRSRAGDSGREAPPQRRHGGAGGRRRALRA